MEKGFRVDGSNFLEGGYISDYIGDYCRGY